MSQKLPETPTNPPAAPTGTDAGVTGLVERIEAELIRVQTRPRLSPDFPDYIRLLSAAAAALAQRDSRMIDKERSGYVMEADRLTSEALDLRQQLAQAESSLRERDIQLQEAQKASAHWQEKCVRQQASVSEAWAQQQAAESQLTSLRAELETAQQGLQAERDKASAYHRRAQQAEAAIAEKVTAGASLGRSLANAGYRHWQERAEAAEQALAEARRALAKAKAGT